MVSLRRRIHGRAAKAAVDNGRLGAGLNRPSQIPNRLSAPDQARCGHRVCETVSQTLSLTAASRPGHAAENSVVTGIGRSIASQTGQCATPQRAISSSAPGSTPAA